MEQSEREQPTNSTIDSSLIAQSFNQINAKTGQIGHATSQKRKREVSKFDSIDKPPILEPSPGHKIATSTRQHVINCLFVELSRCYKVTQMDQFLPHKDTLHIETKLYNSNTKASYKTASAALLGKLKKCNNMLDIYAQGILTGPQPSKETTGLDVTRLEKYILPLETLRELNYPIKIPSPSVPHPASSTHQKCIRCDLTYPITLTDPDACWYHPLRQRTETAGGDKNRKNACCGKSLAEPCKTGPHIFKEEDLNDLHARVPFKEVPENTTGKPIVGLDCEMVFTTHGFEVARLTVVDDVGHLVMDEFIKPLGQIVDYNTQFSGITADHLHSALSFPEVQNKLFEQIGAHTVMIGHGLENDLIVMRILHTRVIDTIGLFPHPRGLPYRTALRTLVKDYLGRFIQENADGHDPMEDAREAMELVRWFVVKCHPGESPWLKLAAKDRPLSEMAVGPIVKKMKSTKGNLPRDQPADF
jgi:RNA exonuclease 1